MRTDRFFITYFLLVIVQILTYNYLHVTHYLLLSILPVLVLLVPIRFNTIGCLFIAFVTGLAADLFGDGVIGLNILALLPVALARRSIIRLIFGGEVFARKEDISIIRHGADKMLLSVLMVQSIFLILYVWADAAGTRPFWFNAARFGTSLLAGTVVSLFVARILAPERDTRWR